MQQHVPTLSLIIVVVAASSFVNAFHKFSPTYVKHRELLSSSSIFATSSFDNEKPNPTTGLIGMGEPIFHHDEYYMQKEQSSEDEEAHYMAATGLLGKGETLEVPKWLRRVFESSDTADMTKKDDNFFISDNIVSEMTIMADDDHGDELVDENKDFKP